MKCKIQEKVINIVKRELPSHIMLPPNAIDVPLHLLGIDSLSFLSILIAIEDEFHIQFPEGKMSMTQMKTLRILCAAITELISEQGN